VIAGAPFARYGARVTLRHPSADGGAELARAFGFGAHPWGAPTWIGLRVRPGGELRAKAYHAIDRVDERFELPREWPIDLYPVMASLDGDAIEIYLRKRGACDFGEFAARCLEPLGAAPPDARPRPRAREHSLCVSLRRERGQIAAVSLYADWRALPRDADVERVWSASLDERDRVAYQLALAGARSTGFLPTGNWHAMLAWTVESDGARHRAVSITVPAPRDAR